MQVDRRSRGPPIAAPSTASASTTPSPTTSFPPHRSLDPPLWPPHSGCGTLGLQDCAVKLFDLRDPGHWLQFLSGTESIRDVQFCPTQPYAFAAADEAGNVKLWDLRFIDKPQVPSDSRLLCASREGDAGAESLCGPWGARVERGLPPERSLLDRDGLEGQAHQGGADCEGQEVEERSGIGKGQVWDWSRAVPSCEYAVQCTHAVSLVRWRRDREWQLASGSLVMDFSINIWDIRRPFIPFASFDRHKDLPTGAPASSRLPPPLLSVL